jgi:hypothetical protein
MRWLDPQRRRNPRHRPPGPLPLHATAEGALFDEFKQRGGNAIEVVTGSHTPDQYATYAEVARRYGFLASRGTDFHAPGEARVEFDKLAAVAGRASRRSGTTGSERQTVVPAQAGTHADLTHTGYGFPPARERREPESYLTSTIHRLNSRHPYLDSLISTCLGGTP